MSVDTTTNIAGPYTLTVGDGELLAIPFKWFDDDHIEVYVNGVVTSTGNYTLTGTGGSSGTLTVVTGTAGDEWLIRRVTPKTQEADYVAGDEFPPETHERALDLLTMADQELKEELARTIKVTPGDTAPSVGLAADRANKYIKYDANGDYSEINTATLLSDIELEIPDSVVDRPSTTWADDAARALKEADFTGQLGVQLDTLATDPKASVYVSQSTTAGDWERVTGNEASVNQAKGATSSSSFLSPRRARTYLDQVSLAGAPYVGFDRDDHIIAWPTSTQFVKYGEYLDGCAFHLRGNRSCGTTALSNVITNTDTTAVARIVDVSGKDRHLERIGTGATPPTYDASGEGALEFPASCDAAFRIEGNSRLFPADMTHNDHGLTVVLTAWSDAAAGGNMTERLFQLGTNNQALLTIGAYNGGASNNYIRASVTTRKVAAENIDSTLEFTTGEANKFIIALRIRDRDMEMWYDGERQGLIGPSTGNSISLAHAYLEDCGLNIGASGVGAGSPANFWEGGISELVFFNRALTTPELEWVVSNQALAHGVALRGQWHNNVVYKATGISPTAEHTVAAAYRPAGIYGIGVYMDKQYASDGAAPRRPLCELHTNTPVSTDHYPSSGDPPQGSVYNPAVNLSSRYDDYMEGGGCIELSTGASLDAYAGLYTTGINYNSTTRSHVTGGTGGATPPGGDMRGFILRYQDELSGTVEDQGTGMWCSNTALKHSNGSIYRMHGEMYNQSVRISRVDPDGNITNVELAETIVGDGITIPGRAINDRYHLGVALVELNSGKVAAMWNSHFEHYLFLTTCSEDLATIQTPQNLVSVSAQSSYIHVVHRTSNDDLHIFTRGTNNENNPNTTEKGSLHLKVTGAENIGTTPATVTYDQVLLWNVSGAPRNNYMDTFRLHVDPDTGKELIACVWNPLVNDVNAYGKMGAILDPDGNSGVGKWYFMDGEECSVNTIGTMATPRFSLTELTDLTGASPAGLILYEGDTDDHNYRACQSPGSITRITDFGDNPKAEVFALMTHVENETGIATFDDATAYYMRYTPDGGGVKIADFHSFRGAHYWSCGGVHQLDEEGNAIIAVAWSPREGRYYTDVETADMSIYYEQGGPVVYVYKISNPFGESPSVAEIGKAEPGGEFTTSLVSHVPGCQPGEVIFDVHAAINELHPTHRQCKRLTLRVGAQPVRR